jgi:uncharacterized membrane protein
MQQKNSIFFVNVLGPESVASYSIKCYINFLISLYYYRWFLFTYPILLFINSVSSLHMYPSRFYYNRSGCRPTYVLVINVFAAFSHIRINAITLVTQSYYILECRKAVIFSNRLNFNVLPSL